MEPRNLRVSDEWYTRFRVSWDPAPAKVNGYKITYAKEGERILCLIVLSLVTFSC